MNTCDRCARSVDRIVVAYWGPKLCPDCATTVATKLTDLDRWPTLPPDLIPDEVSHA
jgi:hypothetical protein